MIKLTYEQWRTIAKKSISNNHFHQAAEFQRQYPQLASEYDERYYKEQETKNRIANITDRNARLKAIRDNMAIFS